MHQDVVYLLSSFQCLLSVLANFYHSERVKCSIAEGQRDDALMYSRNVSGGQRGSDLGKRSIAEGQRDDVLMYNTYS